MRLVVLILSIQMSHIHVSLVPPFLVPLSLIFCLLIILWSFIHDITFMHFFGVVRPHIQFC